MPQPRNNENKTLSADFIFQNSNQNINMKTDIITFSNPVQITPTTGDRSFQENKLMENILHSTTDLTPAKMTPSNKDPDQESSIPKSCLTTYKFGVINNLKEMAKCFGLKR